MHYLDREEAKTNLARALDREGWSIFGFKEDKSDMMTDYFDPESWEGVATKDEFVLCIGVCGTYHSGGRNISVSKDLGDCQRCKGTGEEPEGWTYQQAQADPTGYNRHRIELEHGPDSGIVNLMPHVVSPITFIGYGPEACIECSGSGRVVRPVQGFDPWPEYQANPKGSTWHLERNGEIIAKGVGLSKFLCSHYERDAEKLAQLKANTDAFIAKIDRLMQKATVTKTRTKAKDQNPAANAEPVREVTTPNEPATRRQLWALHCITKKDTRGWEITKAQASDLIGRAKQGEDISEDLPA